MKISDSGEALVTDKKRCEQQSKHVTAGSQADRPSVVKGLQD